MAVGQVYLSHIGDRNIYWGSEKPNIDIFEKSVLFHYEKIRPLDGFANVGRLADRVCRELNIAFIRFEKLFVQLCLQRRGYMTATSLARVPTSKSLVQTLLSRSQAKTNWNSDSMDKQTFYGRWRIHQWTKREDDQSSAGKDTRASIGGVPNE